MTIFGAFKAMVSCQLLYSDVISHCLCVQSLHMSQWPVKGGSLALRSFISLWHHHFFLLFFLEQNGLYSTRNYLLLTPLYLQGLHSLCPGSHVTALFIWFRFISRWSSGHLCVCFLSPEVECPSSFPFLYLSSAFLHLFLLIPSLFFIYFFSWCTLLDLQATGTYSIGHADFCNYLVKDTYTHAYSHVLCPSPSTHSSVLHASLVSPY